MGRNFQGRIRRIWGGLTKGLAEKSASLIFLFFSSSTGRSRATRPEFPIGQPYANFLLNLALIAILSQNPITSHLAQSSDYLKKSAVSSNFIFKLRQTRFFSSTSHTAYPSLFYQKKIWSRRLFCRRPDRFNLTYYSILKIKMQKKNFFSRFLFSP